MRSRFHKIPTLRFEDQKLTSFAGLVRFQVLFARLDFKKRLEGCFSHSDSSSSYGIHRITLLLIVQLIMGFRDVAYYRGNSMVGRLMGLLGIQFSVAAPNLCNVGVYLVEARLFEDRTARLMRIAVLLSPVRSVERGF